MTDGTIAKITTAKDLQQYFNESLQPGGGVNLNPSGSSDTFHLHVSDEITDGINLIFKSDERDSNALFQFQDTYKVKFDLKN